MRILVQTKNKKNINLRLPTRLVFNRLVASCLLAAARSEGAEVPFCSKDLSRLFDYLVHLKKEHPGFELVSVDTASGDKVRITL